MAEAAELRVTFLKHQLDKLMREDDPFKRKLAVGEFRRYLEWWGNSLFEQDRREIMKELLMLDSNSLVLR